MTKWSKRWAEGKTGWHLNSINAHLQEYHQILFQNPTPRILVPLCGRSLDVAWLAGKGAQVIGIDLVEQPLLGIFTDCAKQPVQSKVAGLTSLQAGGIQLIHSDIFSVTREVIDPVDAIYDRAALVALDPSLRTTYVEHCLSLLRPGGRLLLLTYDSSADESSGPPYPVRPGVVEELYAEWSTCRCLNSTDTFPDDEDRLQRRNLTWMRTTIWEIVK